MDKEYLRAGDTGVIRFRFMKKPEFMHVGDIILFREGRTRGKGKIVKIFPIDLSSFNKDKKSNANKKQQPKVNEQNNPNELNNNKKSKKKFFKHHNNNQNQNQINNNSENKNPPKKQDG